eukprot:1153515-Pelagomonas_calceolata.AAC.2
MANKDMHTRFAPEAKLNQHTLGETPYKAWTLAEGVQKTTLKLLMRFKGRASTHHTILLGAGGLVKESTL